MEFMFGALSMQCLIDLIEAWERQTLSTRHRTRNCRLPQAMNDRVDVINESNLKSTSNVSKLIMIGLRNIHRTREIVEWQVYVVSQQCMLVAVVDAAVYDEEVYFQHWFVGQHQQSHRSIINC